MAPAFWDNHSCAIYLFRAMRTFSNISSSPLSLPTLFLDLPPSFSPCSVCQGAAYNNIMQTLYVFDWHTFVRRKLFDVFGASRPRVSDADLDGTFECIKQVGGFGALCWVKTISNAWTTSYRMHEQTLMPCIFGCGQGVPDRCSHYIVCPVLWAAIVDVMGEPVRVSDPSILHRLLISSPHPDHLFCLSLAFLSYHFVKNTPSYSSSFSPDTCEEFLADCTLVQPVSTEPNDAQRKRLREVVAAAWRKLRLCTGDHGN